MVYQPVNAGYGYVVRLDKGENLLLSLQELAEKEELAGAFFYGVGAVEQTRIGRYNLETKAYEFQQLDEVMELASMQGNIARKEEGEVVVHTHAVLGDKDQKAYAGHIDKAMVAITCEIFIHLIEGVSMSRKYNEATGLPLIDLRY